MRVIVVGGGPGGSNAARTLAEAGVETTMIERELTRPKPCGGAIPPLVVEEFGVPESLIDRTMTTTNVFSPSGQIAAVPVVGTKPTARDWVGMVRREVFDSYLRERAVAAGATLLHANVTAMQVDNTGVRISYRVKGGEDQTLTADAVVGADGAHSMVARALGVPKRPQALAIQERIALPPEKMKEWETYAELYLGPEVSPDFYGWVFPKKDHVSVGVGACSVGGAEMRVLLNNLKERLGPRLEGGTVIRYEAHVLPMKRAPHLSYDRAVLVGDAGGLVVGTSGEGIYWAMKSGVRAAEALIACQTAPTKANLRRAYDRRWQREYGSMYRFLDFLQNLCFTSNIRREMFTELCRDPDVQRLTFDSYMRKEMARMPWSTQFRLPVSVAISVLRNKLHNRGTWPKSLSSADVLIREGMVAGGAD